MDKKFKAITNEDLSRYAEENDLPAPKLNTEERLSEEETRTAAINRDRMMQIGQTVPGELNKQLRDWDEKFKEGRGPDILESSRKEGE